MSFGKSIVVANFFTISMKVDSNSTRPLPVFEEGFILAFASCIGDWSGSHFPSQITWRNQGQAMIKLVSGSYTSQIKRKLEVLKFNYEGLNVQLNLKVGKRSHLRP